MFNKYRQLCLSLATVLLYTYMFGWKVAILISATIAWHEYSHILGAHFMSLKTGGFTLIPLVGGVSFVTEQYKTYAQKALVAIAGPIGGGILAILVYVLYLVTGIHFLLLSSYFMLFVQVFNLVPLSSMLDGGQIMDTITYSISRTLGVFCTIISVIIGVLVLLLVNPIIALMVAFFAGTSAWREFKNLTENVDVYYPQKLTRKQMITTIVCWAASICIFGGLMLHIHNQGVYLYSVFQK